MDEPAVRLQTKPGQWTFKTLEVGDGNRCERVQATSTTPFALAIFSIKPTDLPASPDWDDVGALYAADTRILGPLGKRLDDTLPFMLVDTLSGLRRPPYGEVVVGALTDRAAEVDVALVVATVDIPPTRLCK